MRVRRQGIALILVLVASAAVFALAMQGALSSRLGTMEASAVLARFDGELRARSAATIVLAGVLDAAGMVAIAPPDDAGGKGSGNDGDDLAPEEIELPPLLKRMLEESGAAIEDAAEEELTKELTGAALDGGGFGANAPNRVDLTEVLKLGLPTKPIDVTVDGVVCRVYLSDGAGGLNINEADEHQLLRYFQAVGVRGPQDRALTSQIVDWRDDDEFVSERGAERETYERLGLVERNGRFRTLNELLYLPDMTPDLFARIESDLCVASDGRAHLASASRTVLASMGVLSDGQIDAIMAWREEGWVNEEAAADLIDLDAPEVSKLVRVRPSSVIRIRVDVVPRGVSPGAEGVMTFEGAAIVSKRGLQELGLKARTRGLAPTIESGGSSHP